jgi:hypothetical protein
MMRERVVVIELGADERDVPVREAAPVTELVEWRGCGAARGEWEAAHPANDVAVEYLAPGRVA